MVSIKSFVNGENINVNVAVFVVLLVITLIHAKINVVKSEGEDAAPTWATGLMYVLGFTSIAAGATIANGLVSSPYKIAPSSSSNLRQSIEESVSDTLETIGNVKDDFEARVSAAAKKLKESISKAQPLTTPSPVPTASSLAAQASAEIDRFISENS